MGAAKDYSSEVEELRKRYGAMGQLARKEKEKKLEAARMEAINRK